MGYVLKQISNETEKCNLPEILVEREFGGMKLVNENYYKNFNCKFPKPRQN